MSVSSDVILCREHEAMMSSFGGEVSTCNFPSPTPAGSGNRHVVRGLHLPPTSVGLLPTCATDPMRLKDVALSAVRHRMRRLAGTCTLLVHALKPGHPAIFNDHYA